jgi:hypothetical protein
MIVLARAKRKHNRRQEAEDSNISSSSSDRRVRVQDPVVDAHQHRDPGRQANDAADAQINNENDVIGEPQESSESSSSSSSDRPDNAVIEPRHFSGPPHFVTDVSSSNRTDSTGSNLNSSSGSGSAGNTASGTGSGTGSNQGSSGSGNDNDGKGSSDDVAKEGNSGDGTNEGSDAAENASKKIGLGLVGHRHDDAKSDGIDVALDHEGTARERKLIDKKRKRIEMRREYEAQQQSESSENNDEKGDVPHRPGKPITMDQVLQFSKIPRYLYFYLL